jgi:serine/threonine protein kinase
MPFAELKTTVYQEIAIMQALSHHPNVITLIGFTEEPLSIVMKLYDRNLFSLVMAYPEYALNASEYETMKQMVKADTKLKKGLLVKGFEILPEIALHIAYGMAAGMAEMHLLGLLHRDLKSANVLLEYKAGSHSSKSAWLNNPALSSLAAKISGILGQNSLAGGVGWGFDDNGKPCKLFTN